MRIGHVYCLRRTSCVFFVLAALCSGIVVAGEVNTNLPFEVDGSSMWGPGSGFSFNESDFIGIEWDESISIGPALGFELSGNTSGKIGLEYEFSIDSGTVDVAYPAAHQINHPDEAMPGDVVSVLATGSMPSAATMETRSPQATAKLELPFELSANASGSVDPPFIDPVPFTLFPNVGVDATHTFFDISSTNPSFSVGFGDFGSVTASIPTVNTTANGSGGMITSMGTDTFFNVNLDLDEVVSTLIPQVPPLSGSLDLGDEVASIAFDLLDVDADLDANLKQTFQFGSQLKVTYTLETGQQFTLDADDDFSITIPGFDEVGDELDINAKYFLENTLMNTTAIQIAPGISLSVLSGSAEVFGFELLDFGPVFSDSVSTAFDIDVFTNSFALDMPMFEANFSIDVIPEPATYYSLAVGLASALLFSARRRQR